MGRARPRRVDPSLFQLEIAAVLRVREGGTANLQVMLPFVRAATEARDGVRPLRDNGLDPGQVPVSAMAEVRSIIDNLSILAECGFRGASIGWASMRSA